MESHDEERMMFRNLTNGKSFQNYSVKNLSTALDRIKAAATVLFSIPGPKMMWQFGELGYDISIDENGRTGQKPLKWEYYADADRHALMAHFSQMIEMKRSLKIFETTDFSVTSGSSLLKQVSLKNQPYTDTPQSEDEMNIQVAANFEVTPQDIIINFPHEGKWYSVFDNEVLFVDELPYTVFFTPGEYKMYKDYSETPVVGAEEEKLNIRLQIFPNPADNYIRVAGENVLSLHIVSMNGQRTAATQIGERTWDLSLLAPGFYIADITTIKGSVKQKLIKRK